MRKKVNNDVSKDSPICSKLVIVFTKGAPAFFIKWSREYFLKWLCIGNNRLFLLLFFVWLFESIWKISYKNRNFSLHSVHSLARVPPLDYREIIHAL